MTEEIESPFGSINEELIEEDVEGDFSKKYVWLLREYLKLKSQLDSKTQNSLYTQEEVQRLHQQLEASKQHIEKLRAEIEDRKKIIKELTSYSAEDFDSLMQKPSESGQKLKLVHFQLLIQLEKQSPQHASELVKTLGWNPKLFYERVAVLKSAKLAEQNEQSKLYSITKGGLEALKAFRGEV